MQVACIRHVMLKCMAECFQAIPSSPMISLLNMWFSFPLFVSNRLCLGERGEQKKTARRCSVIARPSERARLRCSESVRHRKTAALACLGHFPCSPPAPSKPLRSFLRREQSAELGARFRPTLYAECRARPAARLSATGALGKEGCIFRTEVAFVAAGIRASGGAWREIEFIDRKRSATQGCPFRARSDFVDFF